LKQASGRLGVNAIDFQQSYNRNLFFLRGRFGVLKTEFTFFPFPRIEKGERRYGVEIDSLIDIAVNKLFTIYQRTSARDYIDLYCIVQKTGWQVADLIVQARAKFDWHIDPLQLGTQFVRAEEVEDYPRMIMKLDATAWKNFFLEEAKKFKRDILS
jgi:predicted nucleotidyltransferase component of viral defense system